MDSSRSSEARISPDDSHDLRDALAVTKGWLEVLFSKWNELAEAERFQYVAGALLGANQMCFHLNVMDGQEIDLTEAPEAQMAEAFLRLAEQSDG